MHFLRNFLKQASMTPSNSFELLLASKGLPLPRQREKILFFCVNIHKIILSRKISKSIKYYFFFLLLLITPTHFLTEHLPYFLTAHIRTPKYNKQQLNYNLNKEEETLWSYLLLIQIPIAMMRMCKVFRFSTEQLFWGAETMLRTIYELNSDIQEVEIDSRLSANLITNILNQNREKQRSTLPDQINKNLAQMCKQRNYDPQSLKPLTDIYDPTKGVTVKSIFYAMQKRFLEGSKNNKLYPLHLNSLLMKNIMKILYIKSDNKFMMNNTFIIVLHLIGTPGFGKSSSFYFTKHIHDLRTRYIIRHGCPEDSIFSQHCKLFYFHCATEEQDIRKRMLKQVQQDFGQVPKEIMEVGPGLSNLRKFFKAVKLAYSVFNIETRIIIDQVNYLYNLREDRLSYISNWAKTPTFAKPVIMVSSKNNPYLRTDDPVLSVGGSLNNGTSKQNMDQFLTPQTRLVYTIECFLFQLQKYDLPRSKAIEVLKLIPVPFLTHMAVRNIVNDCSVTRDSQPQKVAANIKAKLQNNQDFNQFMRNVHNSYNKLFPRLANQNRSSQNKATEFKQDEKASSNSEIANQIKSNLKDELDIYKIDKPLELLLKVIGFRTQNMANKQIKVKLQVFDEYGKKDVISKQTNVQCRHIDKAQGHLLLGLDNYNYFFPGYFLRNSTKSVDRLMVLALPQEKISELKGLAAKLTSVEVLRQMQKLFAEESKMIIKEKGGQVFESCISSILQQDPTIQLRLSIKNNIYIENLIVLKEILARQQCPSQEATMKKVVKQVIDPSIDGVIIRTEDGYQVVDFVVFQFQSKILKIILVDTTIYELDNLIENKIKGFQERILHERVIQILKPFNEHKAIKNIQLTYYLLRPNKQCYVDEPKNGISFPNVTQDLMDKLKIKVSKVTKFQIRMGHLASEFNLHGRSRIDSATVDLQRSTIETMKFIISRRRTLESTTNI